MNYELIENCYVLLDGQHKGINDLILKHKDDLILYPEREMRLVDKASYRPYLKSIVTECEWLIGVYPMERVWIWKDNQWVNPPMQTYGASRNLITCNLLGVHQTIPLHVIGDSEAKNFNKSFAYPSRFLK